MVGRFLVGFVCLNLLFSVSWQVDVQGGSCGSNFSFLCHGWQTFSGVRVAQSLVLCHGWQTFSGIRVAQSLVFCVMVGRFLVGCQCGSIFSFLCHGRQTFSGVRVAQSLCFFSWQIFSWVSVAQSLVFCVMVGRLLVGFVWLNLQFSVSWLVDFQWGSCGSIFSFLCHGWQTFSGVRVAQSLVFCVMVGRLLVGFVWINLQFSVSLLVDFQWGSCGSIFSFLCHGWQTFKSLVFCVMVRLLVGFVWLNLQFSVSWQGDFQWGSCGLNLQFSVSWLVDFQWGSCGSIFSFLCHGGKLLVGFVWLNLQFSVSWQVDFQWGSCGSIFSLSVSWLVNFQLVRLAQSFLLCHGWQTFSGVRVAQSLVFGWQTFSVSNWQVDFQWGSCGSIFSFLCHGWQTFSGVRVAQSLAFCVMVGKFLVGFVWLNLQFFVSWQVDFQWASCVSIFSFLCHGWQTFSGVRVAQSLVFCVMVGRLLVGSCGSIFSFLMIDFRGVRVLTKFSVSWSVILVGFLWPWLVSFSGVRVAQSLCFLCHGWQTFSGVRVAHSLVFCVMVGRLLVGFVWPIVSFLCHGRQTFSGLRVSQSLVFCVMVGRLLVGFVWLNLQFSVSWLVDFQWDSCGSIFSFLCHGWQTFSGVRSGVRVAQSLVFCVMVGRLLVGFVWLNLQFSVSWLVDFQWGSCGSIFSFL